MSRTPIIAQTVAENPERAKVTLYGLRLQSSAGMQACSGGFSLLLSDKDFILACARALPL
jgi:hypothetical protein